MQIRVAVSYNLKLHEVAFSIPVSRIENKGNDRGRERSDTSKKKKKREKNKLDDAREERAHNMPIVTVALTQSTELSVAPDRE